MRFRTWLGVHLYRRRCLLRDIPERYHFRNLSGLSHLAFLFYFCPFEFNLQLRLSTYFVFAGFQASPLRDAFRGSVPVVLDQSLFRRESRIRAPEELALQLRSVHDSAIDGENGQALLHRSQQGFIKRVQ